MTMNWKRNSKKYIAGILTIALAVGVGQSYGSMEVSATFLMRKQGVAPTVAIARRRAVCHTH